MRSTLKPLVAVLWLAGLLLLQPGTVLGAPARPGWLGWSWQTDDGLPDNNISGLAQTPDGYLWVAAYGGLVRFNGATFEEFSPLNLDGVPNHVVRAMFVDHANRLWLALERELVACIGAETARVFTRRDGLPELRATAFAEDREGAVWLACGSALCRIRGSEVTRFDAAEGLPAGANLWIASDARGELWCFRGGELGVWRQQRFEPRLAVAEPTVRFTGASEGGLWICAGNRLLKFGESQGAQERARLPENAQPRCLLEDRTRALWVGTAAHGLFRYAAGQLERVNTSHPDISCLMQDQEGNLWAGTLGGGINRVRRRVLEVLGPEAGLPAESVRSVCEAADGSVWVVSQSGLLARGDGRSWTNVPAAGEWPGREAACVAAARDGAVWVGTVDRGLLEWRGEQLRGWRRREGLSSDTIHSLLVSSKGDIWVTTDGPSRLHQLRAGRFHALKAPGSVRSMRALVEDAQGAIWVGTSDGQVLRVEGEELHPVETIKEPRPLSVRYLQATADGSLWIGYAGWGLGRLKGSHYARVTRAAGLSDDYVSQILPDEQGRLWICGDRGIFQVQQQDLADVAEGRAGRARCVVFGRGEGVRSLQANHENFPSAWAGRGGQLWFGLHKGLGRVYSEQLADNPCPPKVWLERVEVDGHTVALYDRRSPLRRPERGEVLELRGDRRRLRLAAAHRKLEFEFAALSFTSPENVNCRYRLKGFDPDWNEAGGQRSASYPRLPAGEYEFQVRACNDAGVWNETGYRLEVAVTPFVWQTWWFRLTLLALFTAGVFSAARYSSFRRLRRQLARLEQQAALQKERTRIARDMHDEVGAKLSRLSLLSELAGQQPQMPTAASSEVKEIAETARDAIRSFEEIVWAVNPRNDSLEDLVHYLCRFAEDLFDGSPTQCTFDLPGQIPAMALPTEARHHLFLAAKEALNNVLKHARASEVRLRLKLLAAGFEIVIEDNGCGFDSDKPARAGNGNGLENMRERMSASDGQFEFVSRTGAGTRVVLRVNSLGLAQWPRQNQPATGE